MKTSLALALLAALGGSASAQVVTDAGFAAQLQGIRAQMIRQEKGVAESMEAAERKAAPSRLLEQVLVSMNDQPGTAEMLVDWIRGQRAVVEFNTLAFDGSTHAWIGDPKTIPAVYISPLAMKPVSHRYIASLIAREASELMMKDYPESAEKRYIVASRMAETFFELGGERAMVDNIDGHSNAKVAAAIWLWVENDPTGGVSKLKAEGKKTLKDVESELNSEYVRLMKLVQAIDQMLAVPNDPNAPSLQAEMDETRAKAGVTLAKLAAVKSAQEQWPRFVQEEKDWILNHVGTLR